MSSQVEEKRRHRIKLFCGGCCCLSFVTIVSLLIAYGVRLGTGDESHTLATMGTCREGSTDASTLNVMSLNTFLIPCVPGARCQNENDREARIREITAWFEDRDEDVVLFQEVWSYHDVLRDGMTAAGFCHYVTTESGNGSGLAVFSKHPITEQDFSDWFDAFGIGDGMAPSPFNLEGYLSDKGVLYAKVDKNGRSFHLFNLHANSDTRGDNHDVRVKQFEKVRGFVDSKAIPSDELVLLGGDFNEDKDCRLRRCEGGAKCEGQAYYNEMLNILSASVPDAASNITFTYDTENNDLLKSLYAGSDCETYQYTLDYIFSSDTNLIPTNSSYCEVLRPLASDGTHLSDHFPVACSFNIGSNLDVDATVESEDVDAAIQSEDVNATV